jgi:hypothetical protein
MITDLGDHRMSVHEKNAIAKNAVHKHQNSTFSVRLSLTLHGEAARILLELKNKGVIRSYSDGVNQAIRVFYEKIVGQELLSARLKALEKGFREGDFVGV